MHQILLHDYPTSIGNTIQNILHSDYTLTGYYVGDTLVWMLRIYGKTDKTIDLLNIAISEYVISGMTLLDGDSGTPYWIND